MYRNYVELKKLSESLPQGSIYRKRVDAERIPFIHYTLYKSESYRKTFQEHGIDVDDLIPEWRMLVQNYLRFFPCKKPEMESGFEKIYSQIKTSTLRPEKFKSVPKKDFRIVAWPYFKGHPARFCSVVDDPDSFTGKAVKSFNPDPVYHGVNKRLPGEGYGRTTEFCWRNLKQKETIKMLLKRIPQDEKYHWYKFPKKLHMKEGISTFGTHGWAIHVDTSHLYTIPDGDPETNIWDAWVSVKYTGPAYVKGSKKENAVSVDMLVLTRGEVK